MNRRAENCQVNSGVGVYYKNMRLDHGHSLLGETDMSVTEVAIACGFASQQAFSRSYKMRFGDNPANSGKKKRKRSI